jgi:threonine synthase
MQYYSLNNPKQVAGFRDAAIQGQAPDRGLYFPAEIPTLPQDFIRNLSLYSKEEIAYTVIRPYIGDSIPGSVLQSIVAETVNFEIPLLPVGEKIYALELFHGPTLAFKDIGARFMSRCLAYFVGNTGRKLTVLVATSGDTGGAVANGFHGVEGVEVVILYPSGKVSGIQEKQLTTLGSNITALEIGGSFDDCQQMVKEAFADLALSQELFLTSANSINVARWLPQQFYYFFALQQWGPGKPPPVFSVPSGNFGNICAGMLAHLSGLPVHHFLAACNANDTVVRYLQDGLYNPAKTIPTMSNAMDVANPSNFVRILELFDRNFNEVKAHLTSESVSDETTSLTIRDLYRKTGYLADPHGAVGYHVLARYLDRHPGLEGIFLETAHPVKFFDIVEPITGEKVALPENLRPLMHRSKQSISMKPVFGDLKDYLLSRP